MAVERETTIDDHVVNVTPWGFLTMMKTKRKLLEIIGKVAPDAIGLIEDVDELEVEDIAPVLSSIIEAFDEETLLWVINTSMSQVHIDGMDMSDEDIRDVTLTANSSLFYKVVVHVLKVNFGDFLEMLQTHTASVAKKA